MRKFYFVTATAQNISLKLVIIYFHLVFSLQCDLIVLDFKGDVSTTEMQLN
jgi:hypothetical protein